MCVFGAPPGTANMGVTALLLALIDQLRLRYPSLAFKIFDYGRGCRPGPTELGLHGPSFELIGAYPTRNFLKKESLKNIQSGVRRKTNNQASVAIRKAIAVLDISGGDSFTDLYGQARFESMILRKQIALDAGRPLILLPQTYGPFQDDQNARRAHDIIRQATAAWSRDAEGFADLRALTESANQRRIHDGVDLAFLLPLRPPGKELGQDVLSLLDQKNETLVGLNISGLLYNNEMVAQEKYGLKADYRQVIHGLLTRLAKTPGVRVLLVPHVFAATGDFESDPDACKKAVAQLEPQDRERVSILDNLSDPRELKFVISKTDWFCGTRMHSTIAGLSSMVPTAAVAYSKKTRGVFATCGQEGQVADPRTNDTVAVVDRLWASWTNRIQAKEELTRRVPEVLARAARQFDHIGQQVFG